MTCRYPIYSGAGNRFFLNTSSPFSPALIRLLCTQAHVDGFLYLEPSQIADAKLTIFNADGSRPTMCGNGLRCAIAYLAQKLEKPQITVATDQGVYSGVYFSWERVLVDMTLPEWNFSSHEIVLSGLGKVQVFFIHTGVPHLVVFCSEIASIDVAVLGRELRYHPTFAPEGANVNFVEIFSEQQLRIRTYERGLERESAACGTGCIAAVKTALFCGFVKQGEVIVHVSQESMKVFIEGERIYLEGPVTIESSGRLENQGEALSSSMEKEDV
ncbi:diaminopimelate epimerase [Chlamydia pecorum]|nr:diaminopimelate epimerase [Chlamydia pecorum]